MDVVVQADEPRWKRLLVADMDSTIIGQECIDELADYAGLKDKVARITERAMQGELDFPAARCASGCGCSRGSTSASSAAASTSGCRSPRARRRWSRRCAPAGRAACSSRAASCPSPSRSRRRSGFDRVKANRLVFAGGKLSGEVGDPIVDAMAKREALIEAREQLGLGAADVLAIGDGANDKLMIEEAGLGVAFRAKPALIEVADAELKHHGLDALLWVQGVRRRDWFRG